MKKFAFVAVAFVTLFAGTRFVGAANATYSFPSSGYAQGGTQ